MFEIAKSMGYDYFLELDDDYQDFRIRKVNGKQLLSYRPDNLDKLFGFYTDFLKKTKQVTSIALAQSGDFIGGAQNPWF